MKRFAWIVAVACVAGCSGLRIAESVPEGPTVLDMLPVISRGGDIYGNGNREPLDLSREILSGRVCWKGRYWEQIGQEKKGELRTVRIDPDGKETDANMLAAWRGKYANKIAERTKITWWLRRLWKGKRERTEDVSGVAS